MAKGRVVQVNKVMPFAPEGMEHTYLSRMLIDAHNAGSKKMQINHGTLKGGRALPPGAHEGYDEMYIVMSGEAVLTMDGVEYDVQKGSVVFIPEGTVHWLKNRSETEDFEVITVWPGEPAPGVNAMYDKRLEAWGTSYREIEE